jgi:hypothetical protein
MPTELANNFIAEARARLHEGDARIEHCLAQLSEAQIWWRPAAALNSIGNLVLHLAGNLRQRCGSVIGGAPDTRNRDQEFAERGPIAKDELLRQLRDALAQADAVLTHLGADRLAETRRYRGIGRDLDGTVLSVILRSLTHFHGHAQEIVLLMRWQLGAQYRFLLA